MQLTTKNDQNILDVYSLFFDFGWNVLLVKNKNYSKIKDFLKKKGPKVILFQTIKGNGVREMEENPIKWHYKKIGSSDEITYSK
jgi:deoxyxylulose-5-phosphate synthase